MKVLPHILSISLLLLTVGCCLPWEQPQQRHPGAVPGWERSRIHTVQILGTFVLKKGESTESAKLGVEVVEISPLVTCLRMFQEPPMRAAVLRFYDPAGRRVLCETSVREGGGGLQCGNGAHLPGIYVNAINTKEGWVWFDLRTTVGDEMW